MRIDCPYCHAALEGDADVVGQRVTCPDCRRYFVARPTVRKSARPKDDTRGIDGLSFALGFFLLLPGLIIAACLRGARGAKSALFGMLLATALIFAAIYSV